MRAGRGADRRDRARMNLWELSAAELVAGYAGGSSRRATRLSAVLARIEAVNPKINAIVTLDIAGARAAADASTARWRNGESLGAFDGVPLTVKDNIPVRGMRATWGSRIYADWVPEKDELPVAKLRDGGAVILGKTNCPEFTLQGYTDNLGVRRHPQSVESGADAGRVERRRGRGGCGGSRSGRGRDRRRRIDPPSCGAHRPGRVQAVARRRGAQRRISRDPARLRGDRSDRPDGRRYARTVSCAGRNPAPALAPARPLRILYVRQFGGSPVDPEIAASVAAVASHDLAGLGHNVEAGEAPFDVDALKRAWPVVSQVGLAWLLREYAGRLDRNLAADAGHGAQRRMRSRRPLTSGGRSMSSRSLRQTLAAFFARYDLILTPTHRCPAWPAAEPFPPAIDGQTVGPRGHAVFTAFANMAGCPAISMPCAPSKSGLPIGFQLVGAIGQDETLLDVAAQFERTRPWAIRSPM